MDLDNREIDRHGNKAARRTRTPSPTLSEKNEPGDLDEAMSRLAGFNAAFMAEFARRKKSVWVRR